MKRRGGGALAGYLLLAWLLVSGMAISAISEASADRAGLLFTPQESLRTRFDIVRRAQHRITVSTFSVNPDEAGLAFLEELAKKARAGVPTRLLMDGVSHRRDRGRIHDILYYLQASGVEIREYISETPSAKLQRALGLSGFGAEKLHTKVTIGDEIAVTGGRNLNNQGLSGSAPGAHDVDAIFSGPAVAEAQAHLDDLWVSRETRPHVFKADPASLARGRDALKRAVAWMEKAGIVNPDAPGDPLKLTRPVRSVRFLHDGAQAGRGPAPTARALQKIFGEAKDELLLSNHTANLTKGFWDAFGKARRNGARVSLVTNGETRYPGGKREGRWDDYVRSQKRFAEEGISVSEIRDRASLHTKVAAIDGKRIVVSSFNLEPASEYLNKEAALVVDDEALAARLKAYIQRQEAMGRRVVDGGRVLDPAKKIAPVDCGTAFRLLQLGRGFR